MRISEAAEHAVMKGSENDRVEETLTQRIIGVFFDVYNDLGIGFLESVYSRALLIALRQAGFMVESEVVIPVSFRGEPVGVFRADLVVENKVILEIKTADQISKAHEEQIMNYLRSTRIEVGLILNFGETPRPRRMYFPNERKRLAAGDPHRSLLRSL